MTTDLIRDAADEISALLAKLCAVGGPETAAAEKSGREILDRLTVAARNADHEAKRHDHPKRNAAGWLAEIREMVAALEGADGDAARRTIEESAISVQVRDGWRDPGAASDGAEEYEILLTTGGPALRLVGDLDGGQPDDDPRLEYQDWGLPWTEFEPAREFRAELQAFASVFYFGE